MPQLFLKIHFQTQGRHRRTREQYGDVDVAIVPEKTFLDAASTYPPGPEGPFGRACRTS
jgi:hypothetical protein